VSDVESEWPAHCDLIALCVHESNQFISQDQLRTWRFVIEMSHGQRRVPEKFSQF